MKFFGSSGIRRKVDFDLLELTLKVGIVLGRSARAVLVGRDTRTSSEALKFALSSGLLASGCSVYEAGIAPTPTIAYACRNFAAGAIITASHNPPEYNGIKLVNPDGAAFDSAQRQLVEDEVLRSEFGLLSWDRLGKLQPYPAAIEEHLERILQDFPPLKVKVVVDCGCGAGSMITPFLLQRLGCEVLTMNSHPSGFFPRPAEPTEENLTDLIKVVRASKAAVGLAHDGDADRLMAVDDKGRFIPGDKLLIILAQGLQARKVVTTLDASMVLEECGLEVERTKIGDPYVSEALRRGGDFGAEPTGCWIFPRVSLCPDGVYAAAFLTWMASEKRLSSLVDGVPSYPILRRSLPRAAFDLESLAGRLETLGPASVSKLDGLKLSFSDGWVLLRPSGTEPKVRVTIEAQTGKRVRELFTQVSKILQQA